MRNCYYVAFVVSFLFSAQAFAWNDVCVEQNTLKKFKVAELSDVYVDQLLDLTHDSFGKSGFGGSHVQAHKLRQYSQALKALREGKVVRSSDVRKCQKRLSLK